MDRVHSYEQRSLSELGLESGSGRHRFIIVNRREPNLIKPPINETNSRFAYLKNHFTCLGLFKNDLNPRRNFGYRVKSNLSSPDYDEGPFPSNEWRTSKYTLLNFIPKNLFEQFRRLANFYFLATAVLQLIIPLSPVGPATSLLPLIFVVSSSAIKQAYEDYLRHRLDEQVNNAHFHVLRDKKLVKIRSKDIKVGDFVFVRNNEEIPCDMILIDSSGSGGKCYITTANLDGETSLKGRSCFQIREQVGNIEKLDNTLMAIECELPNATLYEFNAIMCVPKDLEAYKKVVKSLSTRASAGSHKKNLSIMQIISRGLKLSMRSSSIASSGVTSADSFDNSHLNQIAPNHEIPLDINNLLLRASRLRNTAYIYGLAIYTGKDTKLAYNSQLKSNKFSSLEKRVNLFLLIAFSILLLFSFVGALLHNWDAEKLKPQKEYQDSFLLVFVAHFLLYNYMIPISLYVTLEFIKFFGTSSVVEDKKMKYSIWNSINPSESKDETIQPNFQFNKTNQDPVTLSSSKKRVKVLEGPRCNSSDLNEELGQVQVLFSDKTGTLTENKMRFMACSIYGYLYRHLSNNLYQQPSKMFTANIPDVVHRLAKISTGRPASLVEHSAHKTESKQVKSSPQMRSKESQVDNKPFDHQKIPALDKLKLIDILEDNEQVVEFFICLCLCSTLTLNEKRELSACLPDKGSEELDYESASPDEESLISAAHQHGISLCKSDDQDCYIAIRRASSINPLNSKSSTSAGNGKQDNGSDTFRPIVETKNSNDKYIVRHFQRLIALEFDSSRKRMSVIYRDCDTNCYLMVSKGSESLLDCIKLEDLTFKDRNCINVTLAHFEAFAVSGLRTLLVARRLLSKQEYDQIKADLRDARLSLQNRDIMMRKLYQKVERNLKLIGTTAVEDTLQDGVPETIASLKEAGIKVWLLTGDKVETAISVAYLCKLLDHEMTVIHLVRQQDSFSCQHFLANVSQRMKHPLDDLVHFDVDEESSFLTRVFKNLSGHPANSTSSKPRRYALIADGRSLHFAMKYAKKELAEICASCICVLGCRLSPLQKAEVVAMVKEGATKPITAAIGDGANDVSMIQEAHVGIGVSGKEGRQAVNSGDFAISRFHMLSRLLFVHGHLFYHRASNTINYFFYKNLLFVLPQFYYSLHNPGAVISLYHPILLISFNLIFTSLPILLYGLFEVHILEIILRNYPQLYQINKSNRGMRLSVFFSWLASATTQSTISYYLLFYNWSSEPFYHGEKVEGVNGFALMIYFIVISVATCNLFLVAKSHNFAFLVSEAASFLSLPLFLFCYSLVDWSAWLSNTSFYGDFTKYLKSPLFWISIAMVTTASLAPTIIWYVRDRVLYFRRLNSVLYQTTVAN